MDLHPACVVRLLLAAFLCAVRSRWHTTQTNLHRPAERERETRRLSERRRKGGRVRYSFSLCSYKNFLVGLCVSAAMNGYTSLHWWSHSVHVVAVIVSERSGLHPSQTPHSCTTLLITHEYEGTIQSNRWVMQQKAGSKITCDCAIFPVSTADTLSLQLRSAWSTVKSCYLFSKMVTGKYKKLLFSSLTFTTRHSIYNQLFSLNTFLWLVNV